MNQKVVKLQSQSEKWPHNRPGLTASNSNFGDIQLLSSAVNPVLVRGLRFLCTARRDVIMVIIVIKMCASQG